MTDRKYPFLNFEVELFFGPYHGMGSSKRNSQMRSNPKYNSYGRIGGIVS